MADNNRTRFKAFITKYALTNGITEIDAEDCFHISPTMISDTSSKITKYHDGDWHRTKEAALVKAEEMRVAKISNLRKQIAKLENLKFSQ